MAISLRLLITLPVLLQLVGLAMFTGYRSFQGGQRAIKVMARRLLEETSDRVSQELDDYFQMAQRVNRDHAAAFESGVLDLQDLDRLHRFLSLELYQHRNLSSLIFVSPEGDARLIHRLDPRQLELGAPPIGASELPFSAGIARQDSPGELMLYSTDDAGNLGRLKETLKNFDIRECSWYRQAVETGQPGWSGPFQLDVTNALAFNAHVPVYNEQQVLQGVFAVDISLNQISEFLSRIQGGESGAAFIVGRDGALIAASVQESYATAAVPLDRCLNGGDDQTFKGLLAVESSSPLIREIAKYLASEDGSFSQIQTRRQGSTAINGKQQFVQVAPYQDGSGLDWLIVTVVPEYRFMGDIYDSLRYTVVVVVATLLGAIAFCLWVAQRVAQPIVALNNAAQVFERGELIHPSRPTRVKEVDSLQQAFYQMALSLRGLLSNLEHQVRQQTAELRRSEANLKEAQRIARMGSWTLDVATEAIHWSDELLQIYGLQGTEPRPDCAEFLSYLPPDDRGVLQAAIKQAIATGQPYEIEHGFSRPDGKLLYIISRGEAVFDGQAKVVELVGTATDISDRKRAELQQQRYLQELAEWRDCYEMAATASGQVLFEYDWVTDENRWGPNTEEVLGYSVDQLPADIGSYIALIHPEDRPKFEAMLALCRTSSAVYRLEFRFLRPDNTYIWVEERGATRFDATGRAIQQIGYISNVSEQKQLEQELVKTRDFKELLFNESTDALFLVDMVTKRVLDCNQRAVELFGVAHKDDLIDIEGHTLQKRPLTPVEREAAYDHLVQNGCWSMEAEYTTPGGREFWGDLFAKLIEFGGQQFNLVRVTDISDRKRAELALQSQNAKLERLATVDSLTQIANRRQLEASLQREWQWHQQTQRPLTLIMLDIDRFKAFNDQYGHLAGDTCLRRVAQALQTVVNRPKDLVARYGGEEFTLLLPDTDYSGAVSVAQRIQQAVAALAIANPTQDGPYLTVSMGVVTAFVSDTLTPQGAVARADESLYRAKQKRNTYCIDQLH